MCARGSSRTRGFPFLKRRKSGNRRQDSGLWSRGQVPLQTNTRAFCRPIVPWLVRIRPNVQSLEGLLAGKQEHAGLIVALAAGTAAECAAVA